MKCSAVILGVGKIFRRGVMLGVRDTFIEEVDAAVGRSV